MILGGSYFQRLCDLQCVGEVRNCWFSRMRLVPQLLPRLLLQGRKAGQKASGCVGKRVGRPPAVGRRVGKLPSVSERGLEGIRVSRKAGPKASGRLKAGRKAPERLGRRVGRPPGVSEGGSEGLQASLGRRIRKLTRVIRRGGSGGSSANDPGKA